MKITISLNKKLDYEVYTDFYNFSVAGVNFGEKIKQDHPKITLKNHIQYIDSFYRTHAKSLLGKQKLIHGLLEKKIKLFSFELKKIFGTIDNKKLYRGYLSIFNCNPRYLNNRTFQIFYKKPALLMLEVVFHESLHFIFFEYLKNHFRRQTYKLDKNSGVLWEMSEILNVIILNLPQFKKILGKEEKLFYPKLKTKLAKAKILWISAKNIDDFISQYLKQAKI